MKTVVKKALGGEFNDQPPPLRGDSLGAGVYDAVESLPFFSEGGA
ncbi:MAG: hypothetical protein ACLVL7_08695 [Anaerotruncus massiliensis (ex Togo et al. 2019)]